MLDLLELNITDIATAKGVRTYYNRLSIALAVGAGFVLKLSVNFGHL